MIKKTSFVLLSLVIVLVMLSAFACAKTPEPAPAPAPAPAPEVKPIEWRLQTAFAPLAGCSTIVTPRFIENIDKKSGGKFKITFYAPNAIVGAREIFEATSKGAIEMGNPCGAYHMGALDVAGFEFGLPLNVENQRQGYDLYTKWRDGIILKTIQEAYAENNIKFLDVVFFENALMTKFPVNSLADLDGKKIRAVGFIGKLIQGIGVSPVAVPNPEIYTTLERGTADGLVMAPYTLKTQHYDEVVDYLYYPILNAATLSFFCNADAFNALPAEFQKLLVDEVRYAAQGTYLDGKDLPQKYLDTGDPLGNWEERDIGLIQASIDAGRVTKGTHTDEVMNAFKEAAKPIWEEAAQKSPRVAKLVQLNREYIEEKGLFK